ncbi:MAG: alpha/beta hydrolase [bacterium]|nr:alpha/beta hydrolase [bacterium]
MSEPRLIKIGDHAINVLSHGEGARHFTCLHGLVDTLDIWKRLAPALEMRGRVTRIDQRGHGASEAPAGGYSRADLAGDVIGVLDAEGIDQTILVGHSMGGIVAMEAALRYPKRIAGLVLIGTTSECRQRVADWYERIAVAAEQEGNSGLARAIYGDKSTKQIVGDPQGIAHVTRMLKSLFTDPLTSKLHEIRCPALMAVGEKDPMGPKASEIVHAALPEGRAELLRVPEKGHWLQLEAVDEVVAALDAWRVEFEL